MPGRKRPSMSAVKRMAHVNPERLASEVAELRKAVDDLQIALGAKIATYVRTIGLAEGDMVVIRAQGISTRTEDLAQVAEHAAKILENRYGRPIPVIVESGAVIEKRQGGSGAEP